MINRLLFAAARIIPFKPVLHLSGMPVFLPFYHIISDEPAPHVQALYPVRNSAQFSADLDWILRWYEPVSLADITSGRDWKKPVFHLSFDDGLRQCFDTIAPVLLQKGIPATFFINPAFVDNRDLMFRYKAALIADRLPHFREKVLSINYRGREDLDKIAVDAGINFIQFLTDYQPYLTSDQIQSLINKGFSVGAHSMDHPLYGSLSLADQLSQTRQSISWIQEKLGVDKLAFAFPFTDFGTGDDFFRQLPPETHTFGCAGVKKERVPHHFQRFAMEKHSFSAREMITAAYLAYLAKKLIRREYAKR